MGRNRTGIEERILQSAGTLFYLNGFPVTGVAEIVEKAGTNKTSFYHYYGSKEELGRKYINHFHRAILRKVIRLMRKSRDPVDFCRRWFRLVSKNAARDRQFNGCPLANYNFQLEFARELERKHINHLTNRWLRTLTIYFNTFRARPKRFAPFLPQPKAAYLSLKFLAKFLVLGQALNKAGNGGKKEPATIARMLFTSYQGSLTAWKLTGDLRVFDDACEMIVNMIDN